MTPEIWTIIGTGVAIAALIIASNRSMKAELKADIGSVKADLKADIGSVKAELGSVKAELVSLRDCISRLEGKMELLLQGLQIRIEPRKAGSAD